MASGRDVDGDRIRVLLADGEPVARLGVRRLLDAHPDMDVVGEVGDGPAAVAFVLAAKADVVLMDVRMPRLGGLEALRAMGGPKSRAKIVLLTTRVDTVHAALRGGASGCLLKGGNPVFLVEAVRAAMSGGTVVSPSITTHLLRELVRPDDVDAGVLSARELETVRLVARGMTNDEIAERMFISLQTVKSHVNHALGKLGLRNRVELAVWAHRLRLT